MNATVDKPKTTASGKKLRSGEPIEKFTLLEKVVSKILPWEDETSRVTYWRCLCKCGNEFTVEEKKLMSDAVISCRDCNKKWHGNSTKVAVEFDGQVKPGVVFGKLKIVEELPFNIQRGRMFLVECECGRQERYSEKSMIKKRPLRSCVECIGKV